MYSRVWNTSPFSLSISPSSCCSPPGSTARSDSGVSSASTRIPTASCSSAISTAYVRLSRSGSRPPVCAASASPCARSSGSRRARTAAEGGTGAGGAGSSRRGSCSVPQCCASVWSFTTSTVSGTVNTGPAATAAPAASGSCIEATLPCAEGFLFRRPLHDHMLQGLRGCSLLRICL